MKIPKTLMLGGYEIAVETVLSAALPQCGDWNLWFHRIRINVDGTSEDKQAETVLHEIVEAISDFGELGLEERQIKVLSTLLFAAIRQNNLTFLPETPNPETP